MFAKLKRMAAKFIISVIVDDLSRNGQLRQLLGNQSPPTLRHSSDPKGERPAYR